MSIFPNWFPKTDGGTVTNKSLVEPRFGRVSPILWGPSAAAGGGGAGGIGVADHAAYRAHTRAQHAAVRQQRAAEVAVATLRGATTAELVMELLGRGFVAIKIPADGSLPERLKP